VPSPTPAGESTPATSPKAASKATPKAASKAASKATPKAASKPAVKPGPKTALKAGARAARPSKAVVARTKSAIAPAYRHPNLGLAPIDMTSTYPAAAAIVRREATQISVGALKAALNADPTFRSRYDETGLRLLARDAELLSERLAMCLGSGEVRWLTDYAEWIGPIERRRGVSQGDLATLCRGMIETLEPTLGADELGAATRAIDAAAAVFRRNGRVGGDRHKRIAFLKWIYRGV
jgi:hypothetical protein